MHATALLDRHPLGEVDRGSLDEPLGEKTQAPSRAIADHEGALSFVREVEDRDVGVGIQLSHLGVDDVVERQQEWLRRVVAREEVRVARCK